MTATFWRPRRNQSWAIYSRRHSMHNLKWQVYVWGANQLFPPFLRFYMDSGNSSSWCSACPQPTVGGALSLTHPNLVHFKSLISQTCWSNFAIAMLRTAFISALGFLLKDDDFYVCGCSWISFKWVHGGKKSSELSLSSLDAFLLGDFIWNKKMSFWRIWSYTSQWCNRSSSLGHFPPGLWAPTQSAVITDTPKPPSSSLLP